jgi:hypothetical protein
MPTNDGNIGLGDIKALVFGNEGVGTYYIKSSDTEQSLGVVDTCTTTER